MERAVIYCRTNSSSPTGIENQEKVCRKFADENNYAVEKVYADSDTSGADIKTCHQLHSLIGYLTVTEKRPYYLIVATIDRLGRNLANVALLFDRLSRLDVKIMSADKNQQGDNNAGEKLTLNLIGAFRQYESELRSERIKQGLKRKKNKPN